MIEGQPGDIFATMGQGLTGLLIREATAHELPASETRAHTGILVSPVTGSSSSWYTDEAFGSKDPVTGKSGLRRRIRDLNQEPVKLIRIARTEFERQRILAQSHACLIACTGYDWVEIERIATRFAQDKFHLPLAWVGEFLFDHLDSPTKGICSNYVAQCVNAGRPDISLSYPANRIWPEILVEDLEPYNLIKEMK